MKVGLLRHILTSPTVYWAHFVFLGTFLLVGNLIIVADYKPHKITWIWLVGLSFAGLSAFLDIAPPFVVRAQVKIEHDQAAAAYGDVSVVFHEDRVVPRFLSQAVGRVAAQ